MLEGPDKTPRPISETAVEDYFYEVFPNDLNACGTLFGGRLMEIGDRVAASIARRHTHWPFVTTVSVDSIRFLAPATQGETIIFRASINRVWGSSMEIGMRVEAEDYSGSELRHIFSAYYTFVALSEEGKPIKATPAISETDEQKRRYAQAEQRRLRRLS